MPVFYHRNRSFGKTDKSRILLKLHLALFNVLADADIKLLQFEECGKVSRTRKQFLGGFCRRNFCIHFDNTEIEFMTVVTLDIELIVERIIVLFDDLTAAGFIYNNACIDRNDPRCFLSAPYAFKDVHSLDPGFKILMPNGRKGRFISFTVSNAVKTRHDDIIGDLHSPCLYLVHAEERHCVACADDSLGYIPRIKEFLCTILCPMPETAVSNSFFVIRDTVRLE